jgi:hypothetical protein
MVSAIPTRSMKLLARGLLYMKPSPALKAGLMVGVGLLTQFSPLGAQTANPNHVLELDGKDGYVELPPNIFNHLTAATVEGWMKWNRLGHWLRFFDFGTASHLLNLGEGNGTGDLEYLIVPQAGQPHDMRVPNLIQTNTWYHLAAVSGPGGMKLYVNGVLVGFDPFPGSFASVQNEDHNRFGRDVWSGFDYTCGQMDEIRIWKVERSEEQIRDNMFRRLSGEEADLVGLWNFEDGTARDSSRGHHDGQLLWGARVLKEEVPTRDELVPPSVIYGTVSDVAGKPLPRATVQVEQQGVNITASQLDSSGSFSLVISPNARADVSATDGDQGVWQFGIRLQAGERRRLDLVLRPAVSLTGRVLALR